MFSQRLIVILMFIGCKYHSLSLISTAYAVSVNYTRQDVLNPQDYHAYITRFNSEDDELYQQHIPNHDSWRFLERNIPLFDCPDKELEMTYYFRWWTYRKHIKRVDAVYNSSDAVESTLKYVITWRCKCCWCCCCIIWDCDCCWDEYWPWFWFWPWTCPCWDRTSTRLNSSHRR